VRLQPRAEVGRPRPLEDACDELEALLTCPVDRTSHRVMLDRGSPAPAVDMRIWTAHVALHNRGHTDARAALVEHYRAHAARLAARYHRHSESLEDLEQVALEGLVLALDRFDPDRSLPFLAFANPTITGLLKRHFRDRGWALRVPRSVHETSGPLRAAHDQLVQDLGRTPTLNELSDATGISVDRILATREAEQVRSSVSIEPPSGPESEARGLIGEVDPSYARLDERLAVERAIRRLPDEARELLGLYYEDGLTQSQIAERLGCSQMNVSRRLERAIVQLRTQLRDA
jgi:RNA polymerase sigma-B factor